MKRILGIDPGFGRLGLAVVEFSDQGRENLVYSDCLSTSSKLEFDDRLMKLSEAIGQVIGKYKPEVVGVEKIFFSGNQKTALAVAEMRGAIIYQAKLAELPLVHLTPLEVKMALTSYGRASKEQVEVMVEKLLNLKLIGKKDDEIDAIAIALATLWQCRNLIHTRSA